MNQEKHARIISKVWQNISKEGSQAFLLMRLNPTAEYLILITELPD